MPFSFYIILQNSKIDEMMSYIEVRFILFITATNGSSRIPYTDLANVFFSMQGRLHLMRFCRINKACVVLQNLSMSMGESKPDDAVDPV